MKTLSVFIKCVINNRLSQILVVIHSVALFLIYSFKPAQKGFTYHFSEEPFYYQLLFIIDFPSILITGLIFYPIYSQNLTNVWWIGSYYFVLLILSTIQWGLIGWGIWKIWSAVTIKRFK